MMIQPRIVQVRVGFPGSTGRTWSDLYIKVSIKRVLGRTPNEATVQIYNLAPLSLIWLEQSGLVMQVLAGSPTPSNLFYGELLKRGVRTKIDHPNQVTELKAKDGKLKLQTGKFSASYPAGTTRSRILTDLLAINALVRGYVAPIPERIYQAETVWLGRISEVLDQLYEGEDATWSIQDGALQVVGLGQPLPGNVPLISSGSGMIGSPERTDKGVKVKSDLDPTAKPGAGFALQSRLISGQYRTTAVEHELDTELQWETERIGVAVG